MRFRLKPEAPTPHTPVSSQERPAGNLPLSRLRRPDNLVTPQNRRHHNDDNGHIHFSHVYAGHHVKGWPDASTFKLSEGSTSLIFIPRLRLLRLREVRQLSQGHTAKRQ